DRHPRLIGKAEHRAGWRGIAFTEAAVGDDAPSLARAAAQRGLLEGTADELPRRHQHIVAGDDRQLHPREELRLLFDLAGDQLLEHQAALAVADQHERTSTIAGADVVAPGGEHVAISDRSRRHDVLAELKSGNRSNCHLPVNWREGT